MTGSEIKYNFVKEIANGKLSLKDVQQRIQEYEQKYGIDFFDDYDIEKKEKPWNKEYLKELEAKILSGIRSKQFILHLAEVSEYVYTNEKTEINKHKTFLISTIIAVIVVVTIILCCIKWLTK